MLALLCCLYMANGVTEYRNTDVFQPFSQGEVRLDEQGNLYALAFPLGVITVYNPDGSKKVRFGGLGDGPGKMTYPLDFWVSQDNIYVFDFRRTSISQFDSNGQFIKRWAAPHRNVKLIKVNNGWIYGNWGSFGKQNTSKDILWADDEFKTNRVVCQASDLGFKAGMKTHSTDTKNVGIYTPFENRPILLAARDGEHVYLSDTNDLKILVISATKKEVVRTITHPSKPLPFDEDWADNNFILRADPKMRARFTWEKNYPDYFPAIRSITLSGCGNLVINRWHGDPDNHDYFLTLSPKGEVVDHNWSREYLDRYVGSLNGYVYLTTWDDEAGEAGVARVPAEEALEFAKGTAITYDGPRGRSISY